LVGYGVTGVRGGRCATTLASWFYWLIFSGFHCAEFCLLASAAAIPFPVGGHSGLPLPVFALDIYYGRESGSCNIRVERGKGLNDCCSLLLLERSYTLLFVRI